MMVQAAGCSLSGLNLGASEMAIGEAHKSQQTLTWEEKGSKNSSTYGGAESAPVVVTVPVASIRYSSAISEADKARL